MQDITENPKLIGRMGQLYGRLEAIRFWQIWSVKTVIRSGKSQEVLNWLSGDNPVLSGAKL